MTEWC